MLDHSYQSKLSCRKPISLECQRSYINVPYYEACCIQDMRARVEASQSQHAEMLRRAQDICIEAEDRTASMEKKADKAEARANKAEAELNDAKSEGRRLTNDLKVHRPHAA